MNSSRGQSITSILIGMAIMSAASLSAMYLIGNAKKLEVNTDISTALNQAHILHLQKIKNATYIRQFLQDGGYDLSAGTLFYKCLSGQGTNCQSFCQGSCSVQTPAFQKISSFNESAPLPGRRNIVSSGQFAVLCSGSSSCETIAIRVHSGVQSNTASASSSSIYSQVARNSEIRIPGIFLTNRSQISFQCVLAGNIPTGIDLQTLQISCQVPQSSQVNCAGNTPISDYSFLNATADCAATNHLNCPSGIAMIGAMQGQGACVQ